MDQERVPRLSLDLLRGFRAAACHLSFTRAAQELFVTQSAISREIAKLEEQLGKPLFRRINRTLQLTPAGRDLYRAVDQALAVIDAATRTVIGQPHSLAITTSVPLASFWLGPRLPAFTRLHPEIDIRLKASDDVLDMEREQIDVAIRYVPNGSRPPSSHKLFDYETFPVCSPALASDPSRPIASAADLANHVLLDFETVRNGRGWYEWPQWVEAMGIRGVKPTGLLRFSHYDQVVQAAVEGCGIAIGKSPHLARHLREGLLVAPFGEAGAANTGTFHVVMLERAQSEAARIFVDWLQNEAQEQLAVATAAGGRASRRVRTATSPSSRGRA